MELRGKLTDIIGTREGEGSGLVTCRDTCSTLSVILGDIPEPGTVSLPARPQREKSSGVRSSLKDARRRLGYTREAPVTWRTHRICIVSSLLDMSPAPPASGDKDCRVALATLPVHQSLLYR